MNYLIIGIHKCGTTSLESYLKKQGHDVIRWESAFWDKPKLKTDRKIAIILRDPIMRTWSHYNYKKYHQKGDRQEIKCNLKEALVKHPELITHSCYNIWLEKYPEAEIFWLGDMVKKEGFPKLTTSKYVEELTTEKYNIIKDALETMK